MLALVVKDTFFVRILNSTNRDEKCNGAMGLDHKYFIFCRYDFVWLELKQEECFNIFIDIKLFKSELSDFSELLTKNLERQYYRNFRVLMQQNDGKLYLVSFIKLLI